jgi:preprotein translocase subunit SecY
MVFPSAAATFVRDSTDAVWLQDVSQWVIDWFQPRSWGFIIFTFVLVIIFTFFYTVVIFQQQNLAENLQKQGGFIPGIRPGRPTAEYIMRVLIRITWAGAIFLGIVAIIPTLATRFTDVQSMTLSSTGLIIVVGVVLDTMRQLEAQLMMRDYEGFIR